MIKALLARCLAPLVEQAMADIHHRRIAEADARGYDDFRWFSHVLLGSPAPAPQPGAPARQMAIADTPRISYSGPTVRCFVLRMLERISDRLAGGCDRRDGRQHVRPDAAYRSSAGGV